MKTTPKLIYNILISAEFNFSGLLYSLAKKIFILSYLVGY